MSASLPPLQLQRISLHCVFCDFCYEYCSICVCVIIHVHYTCLHEGHALKEADSNGLRIKRQLSEHQSLAAQSTAMVMRTVTRPIVRAVRLSAPLSVQSLSAVRVNAPIANNGTSLIPKHI
jgi:hypothetical protein